MTKTVKIEDVLESINEWSSDPKVRDEDVLEGLGKIEDLIADIEADLKPEEDEDDSEDENYAWYEDEEAY